MAAKLKKRALADYHAGTVEDGLGTSFTTTVDQPRKKLRLVLSRSSGSTSSRLAGADQAPITSQLVPSKPGPEVTAVIVRFLSRLSTLTDGDEVSEATKRLLQIVRAHQAADVQAQSVLALGAILHHYDARKMVKESVVDIIKLMKTSKSSRVIASLAGLLGKLHDHGVKFGPEMCSEVSQLMRDGLHSTDHMVRMNTMRLLSKSSFNCLEGEESWNASLVLVGKFTHSQDPRLRQVAFETLLQMDLSGRALKRHMYGLFCNAMDDDSDSVRLVALKLISAMAEKYPEDKIQVGSKTSNDVSNLRLVDDAFGKICNGMNDLMPQVREEAVRLIGDMKNVSPEFLEQTLDKKLMSNMRRKKSAHEQEAKMVSSGEWSSGKKWADDAPREELDADSINLMTFGACGAFIHGLEDEYLAVRIASIESLTKLSINNPKLAVFALDFLVDMFNDEIELVRVKAIESLRRIAAHISLQVHQLETILSALDDFSIVVREKLHGMLQASSFATKDGLQSVIMKLLENLKKYPQDKRSILLTFKQIGERHADLTLPLVPQLLEIHPFFDRAEPDIDDPAYLCMLVLVFNAAQGCPTMVPLLDQHTNRHYNYLMDTFPNLMPVGDDTNDKRQSTRANTERFLKQILRRVNDCEHLNMSSRITLLHCASEDLERLGSIEPALYDSTHFEHLCLQSQALLLQLLSSRFWGNAQTMSSRQLSIVEKNIETLFNLCRQLQFRFIHLTDQQKRHVQLLKIYILALHIVYLVQASNKSALRATEQFVLEVENANVEDTEDSVSSSLFFSLLVKQLSEAEDHKPGHMVRILQPLLLAYPPEHCPFNGNVAMTTAAIFEPQGLNETPLKYPAGMILAVPVDCEVSNIQDLSLVRVAIKTPDQRIQLVTPKSSHFLARDDKPHCYRLMTDALMSHQVWSEPLHIEISIVLDVSSHHDRLEGKKRLKAHSRDMGKNIIQLCPPVTVYVLPKSIKRGI